MAEDIREQELITATDCEWIRALDANGNSIKISKADLARIMNSIIRPITYRILTSTEYNYGFY